MQDYIKKILTARVYDVAIESPLEAMNRLSRRLNNRVLLKREDLQPVFSFKLRGAYNKISKLPREALDKGVICASAGNHAQGVALAAQRLGIKATIVMPRTSDHRYAPDNASYQGTGSARPGRKNGAVRRYL